ncbi:MAG: phage tail assembly protein [Pseudomonas sp.]|uniref:phage tail assembly protein n=1 Tax=Pseudomonas sp. TaxID=306 RepID=UPI003398810F
MQTTPQIAVEKGPSAATEPAAKPPHSVDLDTPIVRSGQTITRVTLRKPRSGELRGMNLVDLMQMDVNALQKVLPRISSPILTEPEVAGMDPADLLQLGMEVALFLAPKSTKTEFPAA